MDSVVYGCADGGGLVDGGEWKWLYAKGTEWHCMQQLPNVYSIVV